MRRSGTRTPGPVRGLGIALILLAALPSGTGAAERKVAVLDFHNVISDPEIVR